MPDDVLAHMGQAVERGRRAEQDWQQRLETYAQAYPDLAAQFQAQLRGELPDSWDEGLADLFPSDTAPMATRNASVKCSTP